jgi:hypothetical protein
MKMVLILVMIRVAISGKIEGIKSAQHHLPITGILTNIIALITTYTIISRMMICMIGAAMELIITADHHPMILIKYIIRSASIGCSSRGMIAADRGQLIIAVASMMMMMMMMMIIAGTNYARIHTTAMISSSSMIITINAGTGADHIRISSCCWDSTSSAHIHRRHHHCIHMIHE